MNENKAGSAKAWRHFGAAKSDWGPLVTESNFVHHLVKTVLASARTGNASSSVPRRLHLARRDNLRVRLVGPIRERIAALSHRLNIPEREAARQVRTLDRERADFVRDHFCKDPADPVQLRPCPECAALVNLRMCPTDRAWPSSHANRHAAENRIGIVYIERYETDSDPGSQAHWQSKKIADPRVVLKNTGRPLNEGPKEVNHVRHALAAVSVAGNSGQRGHQLAAHPRLSHPELCGRLPQAFAPIFPPG